MDLFGDYSHPMPSAVSSCRLKLFEQPHRMSMAICGSEDE